MSERGSKSNKNKNNNNIKQKWGKLKILEEEKMISFIYILFVQLDPRRELYGSSQSTEKHTQSS